MPILEQLPAPAPTNAAVIDGTWVGGRILNEQDRAEMVRPQDPGNLLRDSQDGVMDLVEWANPSIIEQPADSMQMPPPPLPTSEALDNEYNKLNDSIWRLEDKAFGTVGLSAEESGALEDLKTQRSYRVAERGRSPRDLAHNPPTHTVGSVGFRTDLTEIHDRQSPVLQETDAPKTEHVNGGIIDQLRKRNFRGVGKIALAVVIGSGLGIPTTIAKKVQAPTEVVSQDAAHRHPLESVQPAKEVPPEIDLTDNIPQFESVLGDFAALTNTSPAAAKEAIKEIAKKNGDKIFYNERPSGSFSVHALVEQGDESFAFTSKAEDVIRALHEAQESENRDTATNTPARY